jgi:hypothetical protein
VYVCICRFNYIFISHHIIGFTGSLYLLLYREALMMASSIDEDLCMGPQAKGGGKDP